MFKVYKWLVYCFMRPYKYYEHLIKCLAIFLAKQNKCQKKTEKRNKEKGTRAYLLPQGSRAGPAHQGFLCRLPQAARQLRARHATAATPPACLAPPHRPYRVWRRPGDAPLHSPPSRTTSPSSLAHSA